MYAIGAAKPERVQQVAMMVGGDRITVPKVVAGNIAAYGHCSAAAGVTLSRTRISRPLRPFPLLDLWSPWPLNKNMKDLRSSSTPSLLAKADIVVDITRKPVRRCLLAWVSST